MEIGFSYFHGVSFEACIKEIGNNIFHPVYFLDGEETYFIDKIAEALAEKVLPPAERDLNQLILYGNEVKIQQILDQALQFPMFGNYKLIIVKEAQNLRSFEGLEAYLQHPHKSTILCFCYMGKNLDKRKKENKAIIKLAKHLNFPLLRENAVGQWIQTYVEERDLRIKGPALSLLIEYLGTDLSKISNALEMVALDLKAGEEVTKNLVSEKIGVSKDFNIFEFQSAIGNLDSSKAFFILKYFERNPKAMPMVLFTGSLFAFFSKALKVHLSGSLNDRDLASRLAIPPFFLKDYKRVAQNFSAQKLRQVIQLIAEYDGKSKGLNSHSDTGQSELMKELSLKILT